MKRIQGDININAGKSNNALWGYPHVKWEIENLNQITTIAPIFLEFNYFRQNIWVNIWVQFHFLYLKDELTAYQTSSSEDLDLMLPLLVTLQRLIYE